MVDSVTSFSPPFSKQQSKPLTISHVDTKSTLDENTVEQILPHECGICQSSFASRNALFRHIRSTPKCAIGAGETQPPKRQRVALLFGYYGSDATTSGSQLLTAFQSATQTCLDGHTVEVVSCTQSGVPNARPPVLGLEVSCPAAEDVMVISLLAPDEVFREKLGEILSMTQALLNTTSSSSGNTVLLHSCRPLSRDMYLHAEQSCTQHLFHYLLPLRWLPGGTNELMAWYRQHKDQIELEERIPTPPALKRLKDAFRSAESRNTKAQVSQGRFGALAHKERRPWHNYADPELLGQASPSHEPVWRVLDRARFHGFLDSPVADDVYIVYEFAGDEFVKQQVRRVVGTAIAITHGWLPTDFINRTTTRDVVVETPIAPANLFYRAGSRFHFEEISFQGKQIFDSDEAFSTSSESPLRWMQKHLIAGIDKVTEENWLQELKDVQAPRILAQLEGISTSDGFNSVPSIRNSTEPAEYTVVLNNLQQIVAEHRWPSTSVARSTVIGNLEEETQGGSFSILNTEHHDFKGEQPPQGNSLFPTLVKAVFDLESALAASCGVYNVDISYSETNRSPSSHCAINCNAQFTPHVDSGRGAGQSLSMIVGLGNYSGGELVVEGDEYDIRYQPLQFDGWELRHWTRPFVGQRFSLVWFTPEQTNRKSSDFEEF